MEAHDIDDAPEIVRWDRESDGPVVRQRHVKPIEDVQPVEPVSND